MIGTWKGGHFVKKRITCLLLVTMLLTGLNAYAIEPIPGISGIDGETVEGLEELDQNTSEEIEPESPEPMEELPGEPELDLPEIESTAPVSEIVPNNSTDSDPTIIGYSEDNGLEDTSVIGISEENTADDKLVIGESTEKTPVFDANKIEISTSIGGMIDPCNMEGKGQMRFDEILITNHNDMPVEIILNSCQLEQNGGIQLVSEKPTVDNWDKWMMVNLISSTIESEYLTETMEPFHFGIVQPGETLTLSLNGEVNGCCTDWSKDDMVNLSFHFEFTPLER